MGLGLFGLGPKCLPPPCVGAVGDFPFFSSRLRVPDRLLGPFPNFLDIFWIQVKHILPSPPRRLENQLPQNGDSTSRPARYFGTGPKRYPAPGPLPDTRNPDRSRAAKISLWPRVMPNTVPMVYSKVFIFRTPPKTWGVLVRKNIASQRFLGLCMTFWKKPSPPSYKLNISL